jgi:hypothetical protein
VRGIISDYPAIPPFFCTFYSQQPALYERKEDNNSTEELCVEVSQIE